MTLPEDRSGQNPGLPVPDPLLLRDPAAVQAVQEFRRRALRLGFGIITLGVMALLVAIYLQFAAPILWGLALAVLFYPVHKAVIRSVRGRATLAAIISTILTLIIVFVPAFILVYSLAEEVQNLWPRVESYFGPDLYGRVSTWLADSPFRGVVRWVFRADPNLGPDVIEAEIRNTVLGLQAFLEERLRATTRSLPGTLISVSITVIVYFFFLKRGAGWVTVLKRALPLVPEHADRLFSITERTINAVFRGVLITAAIQAILAGVGYWVAGAPTPLLLSSVTFITALIPFFGPAAVWVPTAVGLFLVGRPGTAIALALWGACVVSLVDNFLRPYLIGREVKLPLLWLFLAILGGLKLFGFLGIVVGPIALALAAACYRIYMEQRRPLIPPGGGMY